MPRPRMTTRRWLIAVAALALLIAPPAWLAREVGQSLEEFYGPDGQLAREAELANGTAAALDLVRAGRFAAAEAAFGPLAALDDRNRARGWLTCPREVRLGRAAALAGQGRHAEAEPLFRAALNAPEMGHGLGTALAAEGLGWHAATLRALGRAGEAAEAEARAAALRPGTPGPATPTSP